MSILKMRITEAKEAGYKLILPTLWQLDTRQWEDETYEKWDYEINGTTISFFIFEEEGAITLHVFNVTNLLISIQPRHNTVFVSYEGMHDDLIDLISQLHEDLDMIYDLFDRKLR